MGADARWRSSAERISTRRAKPRLPSDAGRFVCPACGRRRAVALKSRLRLLECLDCGRQTSLTAGTAMHRSKLPLTTWPWAARWRRILTAYRRDNGRTNWRHLRRSMVDPDRDLRKASSRWTRTEISFRAGVLRAELLGSNT